MVKIVFTMFLTTYFEKQKKKHENAIARLDRNVKYRSKIFSDRARLNSNIYSFWAESGSSIDIPIYRFTTKLYGLSYTNILDNNLRKKITIIPCT